MILVAISLDPFAPQEADLELPWRLFEHWRMQEWDALAVTDLVTGTHLQWRGARQQVRLEPDAHPFAIWRVAPAAGLPHDERAQSFVELGGQAGSSGRNSPRGHDASETHHEA